MNNPYVGCAPSQYFDPAYAAGTPVGFPAAAPLVGPVGLGGWSIIGNDPAAEPGVVDKAKAWLGEPTMGIKNGYLLGAAAVLGATWYGYSAGWFGKSRR